MPRLSNSLIRNARAVDPLLPPLLGQCRDIGAAQNELRWLREHVEGDAERQNAKEKAILLRKLIKDRVSGKPLQYILGTEYFGDLEIKCRPGVLIPRQDTASSVTHLAHLLHRAQDLPSELRVLDLCTGTGCIPLLFQHELYSARNDVHMRLLGVDISRNAVDLARRNLDRVRRNNDYAVRGITEYIRADVLIDPVGDQTFDSPCLPTALHLHRQPKFWDILISNPPYISPSAFWKTTTRSVRGFEPKLALVPPHSDGNTDDEQADKFYHRLLATARICEAKIVLLEVADLEQALRVARMARDMNLFHGIEIWRDQPDQPDEFAESDSSEHEFPVLGAGNGRSVLCWRGQGADWLHKGITFWPTPSLEEFSTFMGHLWPKAKSKA